VSLLLHTEKNEKKAKVDPIFYEYEKSVTALPELSQIPYSMHIWQDSSGKTYGLFYSIHIDTMKIFIESHVGSLSPDSNYAFPFLTQQSNLPFLDSLAFRINAIDSFNNLARFEFSKLANDYLKEYYIKLGDLLTGASDTSNSKIKYEGEKVVVFANSTVRTKKYKLAFEVLELQSIRDKKIKTHFKRVSFAYSPLILETKTFYVLDYWIRRSEWFKSHYF
jgi:hypothetical protein